MNQSNPSQLPLLFYFSFLLQALPWWPSVAMEWASGLHFQQRRVDRKKHEWTECKAAVGSTARIGLV